MTTLLRRSARIVLAALISGLVVWWTLIALGTVVAVVSNLQSTTEVGGPGALGMLSIGVLGTIYAVPISLAAGLACLPSALVAAWRYERPGAVGPWTCTIGGTICALLTAVIVWLGIWASAAKANPVSLNEAANWLYLLLALAIGGPVAGFIYWRLARHELVTEKVESSPA